MDASWIAPKSKETIGLGETLRYSRYAILTVFLLALIVRLVYAWNVDGMVYPDALFQSKEIAHKIVFDRGVVPWEFRFNTLSGQGGTRNILHALIYVVPLQIGKVLNLDWSLVLRLCALIDALISFLVLPLLYWFLRRLIWRSNLVTDLTLLMSAFSLYMIHNGNQSFSNVLFTPFIYASMAFFLDRRNDRKMPLFKDPMFVAGLILGVGSVFRAEIVTIVGIFALLFYRTRIRLLPKKFLACLCGYIPTGVVLPVLLDLAWFDAPLMSHWRNFVFNVVQNGGKQFTNRPLTWYVGEMFAGALNLKYFILFFLVSIAGLLNLADWGRQERERHYLSALPLSLQMKILVFVLIALMGFSMTENQQLRFLYPLIPFIFLLFAAACTNAAHTIQSVLWQPALRTAARVGCGLVLIMFLAGFIKNSNDYRKAINPFVFQDLHEASTWVGKQPDLEGLLFFDSWANSGGHFYYHADKPIAFEPNWYRFSQELELRKFNYVVVPNYRNSPERTWALDRNYTPIRYIERGCQIWRLKTPGSSPKAQRLLQMEELLHRD